MKRASFYLLTLGLASPLLALAEVEYNLSAPIPGAGSNQRVQTIFEYAKFLVPFMLSLATIAALVMIVWGGIEYMSSGGNPSRVSSAKSRISQAVFGLLLAVSSVIILRTINPSLLRLQFGNYFKPVGNGSYTTLGSAGACGSDGGTVSGPCCPPGVSCGQYCANVVAPGGASQHYECQPIPGYTPDDLRSHGFDPTIQTPSGDPNLPCPGNHSSNWCCLPGDCPGQVCAMVGPRQKSCFEPGQVHSTN